MQAMEGHGLEMPRVVGQAGAAEEVAAWLRSTGLAVDEQELLAPIISSPDFLGLEGLLELDMADIEGLLEKKNVGLITRKRLAAAVTMLR